MSSSIGQGLPISSDVFNVIVLLTALRHCCWISVCMKSNLALCSTSFVNFSKSSLQAASLVVARSVDVGALPVDVSVGLVKDSFLLEACIDY